VFVAVALELVDDIVAAACDTEAMVEVGTILLELVAMADDNAV
jgi:hypothetical protein